MNFPAILIANITACYLMIMILKSNHRLVKYSLLDEKLYLSMVVMTLLQGILEITSYSIDGNPSSLYIPLAYVVNSLLYIINILFAFTWIVYADFKLFGDKARLKKYYTFLAAPAIIIITGAIVNLFTPVFYTISSRNVYTRTDLYILPYLFTYLYLIYGVVLVYIYRNKVAKYMFLPAISFMIPIAIGSTIQFFCYGYSLVWLGVAVAMTSLYINVQNENYYIDSLSGLFTRQYLYNYLLIQSRKKNQSKIIAGIMIDIDRFKSINDTYGHLVGDQAITSIGHILHSTIGNNGFAARFAGDEFVIIQFVQSEEDIQATIQKIQRETNAFNKTSKDSYQLYFSKGCSVFGADDSVDSFIDRLDNEMYKDKKKKSLPR